MPYPLVANKALEVGRTFDWPNGSPGSGTPFYWAEKTMDGINLSHGNRKHKGRWLTGGNWFMRKTESTVTGDNLTVFRYGTAKAYVGRLMLSTHYPGYAHPTRPSNWDTDGYRDSLAGRLANRGAEAWNRLRPAQPSFELGLNLLELKDTPGMLKQATELVMARVRAKRAGNQSTLKKTGEWYLAIQFGWLPVLSAIKDFISLQSRDQKVFDQIVRDAGRPVKRRRDLQDNEFPDGSWSVSFKDYAGPLYPTLVTQCWGNSGLCFGSLTTNQSSKTWAEGQFRYFLPPGPRTVRWRRRVMRRIYGLRPTPTLVYNLMPWSWLADYFTGLGQFMKSVSGGVEDRLAADYFYIMRTVEWSSTTQMSRSAVVGKNGPFQNMGSTLHTKRIIKMRMRGSPFGFGLSENDLSLNQKAILGALGLSRLPSYAF